MDIQIEAAVGLARIDCREHRAPIAVHRLEKMARVRPDHGAAPVLEPEPLGGKAVAIVIARIRFNRRIVKSAARR